MSRAVRSRRTWRRSRRAARMAPTQTLLVPGGSGPPAAGARPTASSGLTAARGGDPGRVDPKGAGGAATGAADAQRTEPDHPRPQGVLEVQALAAHLGLLLPEARAVQVAVAVPCLRARGRPRVVRGAPGAPGGVHGKWRESHLEQARESGRTARPSAASAQADQARVRRQTRKAWRKMRKDPVRWEERLAKQREDYARRKQDPEWEARQRERRKAYYENGGRERRRRGPRPRAAASHGWRCCWCWRSGRS